MFGKLYKEWVVLPGEVNSYNAPGPWSDETLWPAGSDISRDPAAVTSTPSLVANAPESGGGDDASAPLPAAGPVDDGGDGANGTSGGGDEGISGGVGSGGVDGAAAGGDDAAANSEAMPAVDADVAAAGGSSGVSDGAAGSASSTPQALAAPSSATVAGADAGKGGATPGASTATAAAVAAAASLAGTTVPALLLQQQHQLTEAQLTERKAQVMDALTMTLSALDTDCTVTTAPAVGPVTSVIAEYVVHRPHTLSYPSTSHAHTHPSA